MANLVPFKERKEAASLTVSPRFVHRVELDNRTAYPLAMEARVRVDRHGRGTMVLCVEDAPEVDHA